MGSEIYKIKPDGTTELFANLKTELTWYIVFDKEGNLYCSTWKNKIYKISEVN